MLVVLLVWAAFFVGVLIGGSANVSKRELPSNDKPRLYLIQGGKR